MNELYIRSQLGETPLLAAAHNGHLDIVNILIVAGADVNIADSDGILSMLLMYYLLFRMGASSHCGQLWVH